MVEVVDEAAVKRGCVSARAPSFSELRLLVQATMPLALVLAMLWLRLMLLVLLVWLESDHGLFEFVLQVLAPELLFVLMLSSLMLCSLSIRLLLSMLAREFRLVS